MKSCDQTNRIINLNRNINQDPVPRQVVFLCLRNRVRSVFAEFFIRDVLEKQSDGPNEKIVLSSAGFYPEEIRKMLREARVPDPVPFYGLDMPDFVRERMVSRGINVPDVWQSKPLTSKMVREADLVVAALPPQKIELSQRYPEHRGKFVTLPELTKYRESFSFESFKGVALKGDVWGYCEGTPAYVNKLLDEIEGLLVEAFPRIVGEAVAGRQYA